MPVPTPDALRAGLDRLLAERGTPLVVAHRGTTLGSFPDNTVRSAIGALRSGADVIETDVVRATDGEYFLFHTGYEQKLFGIDCDVREMSAQQLETAVFRWQGGASSPGVERLDALLEALPAAWINIDRSWGLWPDLLDHLADRGVEDRILLKSPPRQEHLRALAEHPTPFLYFPIVRTTDELAAVEAVDGINLVGAELLAVGPDDDFAQPEAVAAVAERHPFVLLNALNLENGSVLYLGADDDTSVLEGPDLGWGRLIQVGATAIQTDWPHLLRAYLTAR
ncbi:glycerophosphodiester phosphodiesterase family protein [Brachybacterium paraconglomeratum]|uniref:glycerophosphodiester phosphodiesterase family protein n=1 Tax=Brachybacterium paraconglomeratum TaxID=173362 RepID=UPI003FD267C4